MTSKKHKSKRGTWVNSDHRDTSSLREEIATTGEEIKESIIAAGTPATITPPDRIERWREDFGETAPGAWRNHGTSSLSSVGFHGFNSAVDTTDTEPTFTNADIATSQYNTATRQDNPAMRAVLESVMPHQAEWALRPLPLRTRECWGFGDLVFLIKDRIALFLQGAFLASMAIKNIGGYGEDGVTGGLREALDDGLIEKSGTKYKMTEAGRQKADALEGSRKYGLVTND